MTSLARVRSKPLLFALSAGCAGFALNRFEMPIFGGTALLFGGLLTLLTASTLGPLWGGIAAAIAFSQTWLEWGHPAGFVCYTLEAVTVGWLVQRRRIGLLPATALYWLCMGTPIIVGFLGLLTDVPFPSNWAIAIKYPLNGLIMAAVALPIVSSDRFRRWVGLSPKDYSHTPLQGALFQRIGTIAVLPPLLLILLLGQRFDRTLRNAADTNLKDDASELGTEIEAYVLRHQRDLVTLAQQLEISGAESTELTARMEVVRKQYPGFLTLLIANPRGEIIASAPSVNERGEPFALRGMNVADRDYFRAAMRTLQPYVSGVFRGRGFGSDLIVAISAPILGPGGAPRYVVEGSLNLKTLIEHLRSDSRIADRDLVIADQAERIVLTIGKIDLPALADFRTLALFHTLAELRDPTTFDIVKPGQGRPERHLAVNAHTPALNWHVVLLEPLWITQRRVALFYSVAGVWALVAISLALLLARGTAADITAPLQQLVQKTHALAVGKPDQVGLEISYPSSELTEISAELQQSARTLVESNAQLAAVIDERDQSHAQLRQTLLHLDERVRERTLQLDEARKLAESANHAKSEFLASMSHELRTPLNVILGMSEVLQEKTLGPLNIEQVDAVAGVEESGRHLLSLINDILDLSKIEAGMLELDIQECVVRDVSEASLRFVRESAQRKRITLEASYLQRNHYLQADNRRLKQILVNLLSNAVKFTPDGGRITLEVAEDAATQRLNFSVRDSGIGIAADQLPKLFQSFQQIDSALNRKYAGTGLGLALVKRMTEMHGGGVTVQSEPGVGSCFTVSIPIAKQSAVPASSTRKASENPFLPQLFPGEPLILIAEDHPTNRLLLDRYLTARGCRLIFAANGQEAIERTQRDLPQLVLMDVQMPVLDGLEATRRLKADPATGHIPIITLTALARPEDRLRCLEAGAAAYLSKPLQLSELDRLIHEQLNRTARLSNAPQHVLA